MANLGNEECVIIPIPGISAGSCIVLSLRLKGIRKPVCALISFHLSGVMNPVASTMNENNFKFCLAT